MTSPWAEEAPRREPFLKLPGVIVVLLAVMCAVYAWLAFSNEATQMSVIATLGFVPDHYLARAPRGFGVLGLVWPFFTHLFLHGSVAHLGFNALWLMAVGTPLARRLGTLPFLTFYFVCGAISAATHLAANVGSPVPVVGASGAIAGCMAGALRIMFSPTNRYFIGKSAGVGSLAPLSDRRILWVTLIWIILNFVMGSGVLPMPGTGGAGIAWEAHIGGFIAGLFLIPIFDQWAGGSTKVYPTIGS